MEDLCLAEFASMFERNQMLGSYGGGLFGKLSGTAITGKRKTSKITAHNS